MLNRYAIEARCPDSPVGGVCAKQAPYATAGPAQGEKIHKKAGANPGFLSIMVRTRRLELPRVLPHSDLNAARLPIPPRPQIT